MPKEVKPRKGSTTKKRSSKSAAILSAAYDHFSDHGLNISVDEIASHAGVAKQTIYKTFHDKLNLFAESILFRVDEITHILDDDADIPPRNILSHVAKRFFETALNEKKMRMLREMYATPDKIRPVAHQIYNMGPELVIRELAQYFERSTLRNELDVKNPFLAAECFYGSLKGYISERYWFTAVAPPKGKEMEARINYVVDLFMKGHGVESGQKAS